MIEKAGKKRHFSGRFSGLFEAKNKCFFRAKIAGNYLTHFPKSAFFRKKLGVKIKKNRLFSL